MWSAFTARMFTDPQQSQLRNDRDPAATIPTATSDRIEASVEDRWMRCRDGTRLISRLWHAAAGQRPAPVLLMRQPYGRSIASTVTYAHPHWYARQGFLVVVQDVRGRGDSEGEFRGFDQEASDGADAVRWARQLPGSNGRVGMYGFSYQGLTQLLNDGGAEPGALDRGDGLPKGEGLDPLPDCLAPAMCGLDERQHWASDGGAHWWALGLGWALQLAAQRLARNGEPEGWHQIRRSLSSGSFLEEGLALLQRHDPDGMGLGWLQRPASNDDGWQTHQPPSALLQRPMLVLGGWWDPHLRGVLDLWRRSRDAGGDPGLCIGPWTHLNWSQAQPCPTGPGPAGALSIDQLHVAFFRQHLGLEQAPATAAQTATAAQAASGAPTTLLFDLGAGTWQSTSSALKRGDTWTLQSSGLATLLEGEGRLLALGDQRDSKQELAAAETVWLVHDPWRPLPGRGGHLGLDAGPCHREDLAARSDVACFNTAPLAETLTLQGAPLLEILVQADQPGFDLCCALSVLRPGGPEPAGRAPIAEQLCTGMLRVLGDIALSSQRCRVRFQPVLASLRPGERLRLSVAAAAWPQVAVNPGTGERPQGGAGPQHRVITLCLTLAEARLSMNPMIGSN